MPDVTLLNSTCTVGRYARLSPGGLWSVDHLLADMDHHGVAEALVLDALSRDNHPADGNARVVDLTRDEPRLRPAWSALPPGIADDEIAPAELVDAMRASRVGAVFLFAGMYRFSLSDWCVDELLEPLAGHGVPIFLNPIDDAVPLGWDQTDWESVVALCRRWPTLPVIVSEWRIRRAQRMIYRALDACPNLRIELSGYWLYRGIEYITARWGSERLIWGSNWPTFGTGMSLAPLTMAEIDDADRERIGGGNMRELLAWAEVGRNGRDESRPYRRPSGPQPTPASRDRYLDVGRSGRRPEDMRFLDCHGHLGGRMSHYHIPDGSTDATVREMDRLGVAKACVFSFAGVHSDECFGNDIVIDAARRYPDRFVGFALVNPHRGRDEMLRELDRCTRAGLRGVKLIPYYQGYPTEGPLVDVACEWAHERAWIILNHDWGSPAQMERLLASYPDACFIAGHTTTAYSEVMRRYPNLHVCTCPLLAPRDCEWVASEVGADRMLFGSDLQDLPIAWGLGPVLFASLPEGEKAQILGGSLARILEAYSLPESG